MTGTFEYDRAFARNLGWVTADEQRALRGKRVAIAGLGGVGGLHLLTLVRLGIGKFHLAEFDRYDLANFNRQVGAAMSTLELPKLDVMTRMARDVNPELDLRIFDLGVNATNVDEFLDGIDVFVDGLDFFAFDTRELVFATCRKRSIPAITVAPLGMGAALLNFLPDGMSFTDYFGLSDCPKTERPLRFLLGLAPAMLHRRYLVDMAYVDLENGRGPSTAMACQVCAGIAATESLKLLLRRGKVAAAPRGVHFDAYRNKLTRTWRPWGWRNPLQRAIFALARRQIMGRKAVGPRDAPG